ncbi:MAG: AmiE [Hyphomicrobiales bacterium]|nr:AmiE [Hyphomicrobiales bacterium]
MGAPIRIAALQMRSGTQPEANLLALEKLVAEAARLGAVYVLSPEVTVAFAENSEGLARVAGPFENNAAIAQVSRMAGDYRVSLHLGSLAVALEDGRFANRSVLFGPDGAIAATYDKIHLFDATLDGLRDYRESATYRGGDTAVVVPVAGFTLGMSICYDVRFPALYNALANAGAQVLAVPAAFTVPTGQAHWETLLRARAIETGSYVIAAAQGGMHENGRATYGHSMVIDPWGEIVAEIDGDEPGVLLASIDLDRVTDARRRVPALDNARPFSLSVKQESPI